MQTRSFENAFQLVDYTEELNLIPNIWGLTNELGIFREESVSQNSVTIEQSEGTLSLIGDTVRGTRNLVNKDDTRKLFSYAIPHFGLDDYVSPSDVQGKRMYGSADMAETEAAVIARKLERIARNHAATKEAARMYAITNGAVYAPNGSVAGNYYTDFGVTRKEKDFLFGTTTSDILGFTRECFDHVQDNILTGEVVTGAVVLCSSTFFDKLVNHATVKDAYKYYSSTQEPLRNSLRSGRYDRFNYNGIDFIKYRASFNGTALIPDGDAYMLPTGTADMFITYYGPANKFSHVNTLGEPAYVFTQRDSGDEKIVLQSESNHLHLVRRPGALVRLTSST